MSTRYAQQQYQMNGAPLSKQWVDETKFGFWPDPPPPKEHSLIDKILRLYQASMAGDVRSPLIHLVGPPGCGKSTSVEKTADLLGVKLHIINVSRMSPLDIEGVQMPNKSNTALAMLTATWWTQLKEGDIVLFDEFLRGFPEVYNGLLDILTSRRVGGYEVPKVFFVAASNSVATYDKALEDRLLHLPVPDPRTSKAEKNHLAKLLVAATGMHPDMVTSSSIEEVLDTEVLPMFEMLDQFKGTARPGSSANTVKGKSIRNLIGQVRLRQIESPSLQDLVSSNNAVAARKKHWQYVVLPDGKAGSIPAGYQTAGTGLVGNAKLTEVQRVNLDLNLQLIGMEEALNEKEETDEYIVDGA